MGPDGNLWFTESNVGNKIGRAILTAAVPKIAAVTNAANPYVAARARPRNPRVGGDTDCDLYGNEAR